MVKKFCDECGEELTNKKPNFWNPPIVLTHNQYVFEIDGGKSGAGMDLCVACFKKIINERLDIMLAKQAGSDCK